MKVDFDKYLLSLQDQYDRMSKAIEEVNEEAKKGTLDQQVIDNVRTQMNIITTNYQRVLYCRYLYHLPPKFIQKIQKKRMDKKAKEFVSKQADRESVEKENESAINNIKEVIDNE